jgi:hypothetical protein
MQFQDTSVTPPRIFSVDDSVTSADVSGVYHFYRDGVDLNWPVTFSPYVAPVIPPTLADLQAQQVGIISMACAAQMTGNFTSSALGAVYTDPSKLTDQANMSVNVTRSLYPSLPAGWAAYQVCADSAGTWDYRTHTAAQIQQVGADGEAMGMSCLLKNNTLRAQINAITDPNPTNPSATTIADIQAIVW